MWNTWSWEDQKSIKERLGIIFQNGILEHVDWEEWVWLVAFVRIYMSFTRWHPTVQESDRGSALRLCLSGSSAPYNYSHIEFAQPHTDPYFMSPDSHSAHLGLNQEEIRELLEEQERWWIQHQQVRGAQSQCHDRAARTQTNRLRWYK